jgi:HD domain
LQAIPKQARDILDSVGAPPRLLAHLTLVHEVAYELVEGIAAQWPGFPIDRHAVLIGAATHDVGKIVHPDELRGPGRQHENDGPALLVEQGLPDNLARFARTHGQWTLLEAPQTEDLLVALANLIWVGKRNQHLEGLIVDRVVEFSGEQLWSAFARFDEIVLAIVEGAGGRLALYTKIVQDEDKANKLKHT